MVLVMLWNWVSILMQYGNNQNAIKKCRYYIWLLHATQTPHFWFKQRGILSSGRQAIIRKSMCCTLLWEQSFKKADIFKWCSIPGLKSAPTGKCTFRWNCLFNMHLFLLVWFPVYCWSNTIFYRQHYTPAHS